MVELGQALRSRRVSRWLVAAISFHLRIEDEIVRSLWHQLAILPRDLGLEGVHVRVGDCLWCE